MSAEIRRLLSDIIGDFREALAVPPVRARGYCPTCDTDHRNEARLNRAVLSLTLGRLKQLEAALTAASAVPATHSSEEERQKRHYQELQREHDEIRDELGLAAGGIGLSFAEEIRRLKLAAVPAQDEAAEHQWLHAILNEWERVNACPHYGEDGGLCRACRDRVIANLRSCAPAAPHDARETTDVQKHQEDTREKPSSTPPSQGSTAKNLNGR